MNHQFYLTYLRNARDTLEGYLQKTTPGPLIDDLRSVWQEQLGMVEREIAEVAAVMPSATDYTERFTDFGTRVLAVAGIQRPGD